MSRKNPKHLLSGQEKILIVTEGESECRYFEDFRKASRDSSVVVLKSSGTDPKTIVDYASTLWERGKSQSAGKGYASRRTFPARYFELIYVVFDEDEKPMRVIEAQRAVNAFNKKHDRKVEMIPIISIPNFEFWVLLHFESICPKEMSIASVQSQLKRHMPNYAKGMHELYAQTKEMIRDAVKRSKQLRVNEALENGDAKTNVDELVEKLLERIC